MCKAFVCWCYACTFAATSQVTEVLVRFRFIVPHGKIYEGHSSGHTKCSKASYGSLWAAYGHKSLHCKDFSNLAMAGFGWLKVYGLWFTRERSKVRSLVRPPEPSTKSNGFVITPCRWPQTIGMCTQNKARNGVQLRAKSVQSVRVTFFRSARSQDNEVWERFRAARFLADISETNREFAFPKSAWAN